tara:strand:- start:88 stop:1287 length:1200 start_codon:yes stop_codon:yes gene_type:complete
MKLKSYLRLFKISNIDFSKKIGISSVSLSRYINGERLPEKSILNKIFKYTDGLVDANDFFLSESLSQDLSEIHKEEINKMVLNIREGKLKDLAKAITLVESSLKLHNVQADFLLSKFKHNKNSLRIGITGVPGVGKSTFIETFGMSLIDFGFKVAVLAIDPSSKRTGGSILGDKTRMMKLSVNKKAFIRPSPSQGNLGGVAKKTSESIRCLEEAGFNIIFIETMGVGQAETTVYDMVDIFLVLLLPSGGDELQGIKKGIIEMADVIIINKADGNLKNTAEITMSEYKNAQNMISNIRTDISPEVFLCSSTESIGIKKIWNFIKKFEKVRRESGSFYKTRVQQQTKAIWRNISLQSQDHIEDELKSRDSIKKIIKDVEKNNFDVNNASRIIFDSIFKRNN